MKKTLSIIFGLFIGITSYTQTLNVVNGKVLDADAAKPISGVHVFVQNTEISQKTELDGTFILQNVPNGAHIVVFKKIGYETQYFPISLDHKSINIGDVMLYVDISQTLDNSIITL